MKTIIALALAILGGSLLTACEHEHWHHHDGYYGQPGVYEYGHGSYYDHDWDHR